MRKITSLLIGMHVKSSAPNKWKSDRILNGLCKISPNVSLDGHKKQHSPVRLRSEKKKETLV